MNITSKFRSPLALVLVFMVGVAMLVGCRTDKPLTARVVHVNDTHAHFDEQVMTLALPDENSLPTATYAYVGGYPRLKSKIDQLRLDSAHGNKGFLLLHAGDAFTGSLYFTLYKGQLNADFMNYFDFDAMVLGNHEFDLGNEVLAAFADAVHVPLVSANVKVEPDDPLWGRYASISVKKLNGQPVVIVGLTTEFTQIISSPSDGTQFLDPIAVAESIVDRIKQVGINKIFFVTHLGLEADRLLAQSVDGIDVIIGGHSHSFLGNHSNLGLPDNGPAPLIEEGPGGDPVCIMQAGEHALGLGVTDVEFSGSGIVESCSAQNVLLVGDLFARGSPPQPVSGAAYQTITDFVAASDNISMVGKDPTAQSMLDAAKLEVAAFASEVVGVATEPLYHVRLPGDLHPQAGEMATGSMVAPHVARSMASKLEQVSGQPYVAMMNAGGVRADLTGEITVGSSYTVLPFSSTLVSMTVSGQSLLDTLNTNVRNAYVISGVAFPYVANLRYTVDLRDPANPRVENVAVIDPEGNATSLDPEAEYNLVTTSYLAGGGDLYHFAGARNITDTGHIDADALINYIQDQPGEALAVVDNGITVVR